MPALQKDLGLDVLSLQQVEYAGKAIAQIDRAIGKVSLNRAGLVAAQNRLEHTANNLLKGAESLTATNSRIADADMAKEIIAKSIESVRMQGVQALLAQSKLHVEDVLRVPE